jgi:hypothetical protein
MRYTKMLDMKIVGYDITYRIVCNHLQELLGVRTSPDKHPADLDKQVAELYPAAPDMVVACLDIVTGDIVD